MNRISKDAYYVETRPSGQKFRHMLMSPAREPICFAVTKYPNAAPIIKAMKVKLNAEMKHTDQKTERLFLAVPVKPSTKFTAVAA